MRRREAVRIEVARDPVERSWVENYPCLERYGSRRSAEPGYKVPSVRGRTLTMTVDWARDLLYLSV
jgi:hypothetical protein